MNDPRNESDGMAQRPHGLSDDAEPPDDGGERDKLDTVEAKVPMGFKPGYKMGWRW
jgi:hypothetical protein